MNTKKRKQPIVSVEYISKMYRAAGTMSVPDIDGVEAAAWWRALLLVASCTGIRQHTLFKLRMTDIDWANNRLIYPAEQTKARQKTRQQQAVQLNDVTLEHLQAIQTDRELLFPWPHRQSDFYAAFHRLQEQAGIAKRHRFGLHALRHKLAVLMWELSPAAARMALNHATLKIAERYVNGGSANQGGGGS